MNPFAYRTTSLAIKALTAFSKTKAVIDGQENIPKGAIIFVINHFTRIETLFLPYHLFQLTGKPVWSLADYSLFKGALGGFLEQLGAVSTRNPDRDRLVVKSLLTGESPWIIFPEGRMVKSKKIFEKGRFMVASPEGKSPPHTGAATLALRTEFYRQRLRRMSVEKPEEAKRLLALFQIETLDSVLEKSTYIVPVNITYYPLRAHENAITRLAQRYMDDISPRMMEELMTEGTMLLEGVDINIRFGKPIQVLECLKCSQIDNDISSRRKINFDDQIPSVPTMRKEAQSLMQRYMAAVYNLTTVNLDHLLAALLKRTPFAVIDSYDLRRRVFWVATSSLQNAQTHIHQNLKADQTHLLTDDRFRHYRDFINIALEKEVLTRNGNLLRKNRSKFDSAFDYHQVRIDNPIAVMANEVEPLSILQRSVRWTTLMPRFWLKRKIVKYLMQKILREFNSDYKEFYRKEESKSKSVGRPFLLKGRSRKVGVLLVHGYMAAPLEVNELALYLAQKGYWVFAPRLRGHGTTPDDLALRTYKDWRRSVDDGCAVIRNICKQVVVGGFSTGAGLALDLALRVEDLKGVFAVAPPLRLQDLATRLVPAVDAWNRLMKTIRLDEAQKEFVDNNPENPDINYFRNPISGVREIERLMESLEPRLTNLKLPVLVAQANRDPVVNPKGSERIFELLGSDEKQYILFNFKRHGILRGDGAWKVHKKINEFIHSVTNP